MTRYRNIPAITASKSSRVIPVREIQMKRTLKQRFRDWLYNDNNNESELVRVEESLELHSEGALRFNVYRASGGMVIETRKYDRIKDVNHTKLHIVVDSEDLGNSIGKIITMEALR
jgi:hypothetical protein